MMFMLPWVYAFIICTTGFDHAGTEPLVNPAVSLGCHRVPYIYKVQQSDENGKQCWDVISAMACLGMCDSNEISDWPFPFKRFNHSVCVHYGRNRVLIKLHHCEEGVKEGTELYEYLEAEQCKCQLYSSSNTNCGRAHLQTWNGVARFLQVLSVT